LYHLLVHAKNLKELDLTDCIVTGDLNKVLHLKSLTKLNLPEVVSSITFQNIFRYAENITSLDIGTSCGSGELTVDFHLTSLTELRLHDTNIDGESIECLLAHAGKLEKIHLKSSMISGLINRKMALPSL